MTPTHDTVGDLHGGRPRARIRCGFAFWFLENGGSAAMRQFQQRAAILIALTLGVACFSGGVANAQEVIKIAAGAPLTGALAKQGQEVANAVKLAVGEGKKRGGARGRKIEAPNAAAQGTPKIA